MTITVNDKARAKAADFLRTCRGPRFSNVGKSYRGVVIEVEDDDFDDMSELLERNGFDFDSDQDEKTSGNVPRMPKSKRTAKWDARMPQGR